MRLWLLLGVLSAGPCAVADSSAAAMAPPHCTARDLRADAVFSTGAMNRELLTIRFQNRGTPCALRGSAAVRPLDRHGHAVPAREERTRQPFPGGRHVALRTSLLARGMSAYFELGYSDFDPVAVRRCTPYAENLRVVPPGASGSLKVDLRRDVRRFAGLGVSKIGFCGGVFRVGPVEAARPSRGQELPYLQATTRPRDASCPPAVACSDFAGRRSAFRSWLARSMAPGRGEYERRRQGAQA